MPLVKLTTDTVDASIFNLCEKELSTTILLFPVYVFSQSDITYERNRFSANISIAVLQQNPNSVHGSSILH